MKNIKISVIMPVYNAEKYLAQCIESILSQSLEDIELICIDDCSTDSSLSVLEEYAAKDSRMTVLSNDTNHYAGYCRNRGIAAAKGEYLHFIDSDDYMTENAYEVLYNAAKENNTDMIKAKSRGIDTATGAYVPNPLYDLSKIPDSKFGSVINFYECPELFMSVAVTPWNGIYKREFVTENGLLFNNLKCVNDRSFYISAILKAGSVMLMDFCMICHRVNNPESLIGQRAKNFDCHFRSFNIIRDICENAPENVKYLILRYEMNDLCSWFNRFRNEYFIDLYPEMKQFLNSVNINEIMLKDREREKSSWYRTSSDIIRLSPCSYIKKYSIPVLERRFSRRNSFIECSYAVYVKNSRTALLKFADEINADSDIHTEYIFIDDGSYDGSYEILANLALEHDNIMVIFKNNAGIEECQHTALYAAAGSQFKFCTLAEKDYDDENCENNIKVSVIVPCYNVSAYIRECLDSLVYQTLEEIEIICVNDGSTDNTPEILREYAQKDSRIKIIDKQNSGYGNTMNMGIDAARGEYIGILESDDYVMVDMYESLYNTAAENNLDFVKADFYRFFNENGKLELFHNSITNSKKQYYNKIMRPRDVIESFRFVMNTWSGIYKRSFIMENNIRHNETPGASFQDNGFWFQTFALAERAMFVNKPYYMNRRDNPDSSVHNKGKVYAVQYEYDRIREFIDSHSEKLHHLVPIIWYKKYRNYMFTYNRIAEEYKEDFLDNFSREFHEAENAGELDYSLFGSNEAEKLKNIMSDPSAFYMNDFAERMKSDRQDYNFGKSTSDGRNSDNPSVSVIVPAYNIEKYIRQALDSIVRQSLSDIEIICIDDGSTDNTLAIIQEYAAKDDRFKVLVQKNQGAGAARNKGLAIARGECLSFLDGDDFFEYDMLETAYRKMQQTKADIAVYQVNAYDNDTGVTSYCEIGFRKEYIPKKDVFSYQDMKRYIFNAFQNWPWNKMFRRSFIQRNNILFQPLFRTNDLLFTCTALACASGITKIQRPLVTYRRQSDNSSQATNHIAPLDFYKAFCALQEKLREMDLYQELERSFVNSALKGCIYNLGSLKSGKAFNTLYTMLKNEGFKQLGIANHTKGYFYDKKAFSEYERIQKNDISEYLFDKLAWNRDVLTQKQLSFNEQNRISSRRISDMEILMHSLRQRTENTNEYINQIKDECQADKDKISEKLSLSSAELEKLKADIRNEYYELHYRENTVYLNPKITVIVPVSDNEAEINTRLDSIINQSLPEIEIICINFGSQDDSLAVLTNMHRLDRRISIINLSGDFSEAYNRAVSQAHGEYIMFLFENTRFFSRCVCAEMYADISSHSAEVYQGKIVYQENGITQLSDETDRDYSIFDGSCSQNALCGLIISRKFIADSNISFKYSGMLDDYSFLIKIMHKAEKIYSGNKTVCICEKSDIRINDEKSAVILADSFASMLGYTKENNLDVWNRNIFNLLNDSFADDICRFVSGKSVLLAKSILEAYSNACDISKNNNRLLEKLILRTREEYNICLMKNKSFEKKAAEYDELKDKYDKITEISRKKSSEIEDFISKISEIEKENNALKFRYEKSQEEMNEYSEKNIKLEAKIQEMKNISGELNRITDQFNRLRVQYNEKLGIEDEFQKIQEKFSAVSDKLDEIKQKYSQSRDKIDNLTSMLAASDREKQNIKNELTLCQNNLECTRNAFSHRLGMALTSVPRKIRSIFHK